SRGRTCFCAGRRLNRVVGRVPFTFPVSHAPRYAVVMAGGAGTRFWPRSRARVPKQLLPILGGRSLLAETIARVTPPIARTRVRVVTARVHARGVRAACRALPADAVLVEPE